MAILGIIGGIAPESTVAYYRLLIAGFRERSPQANPHILLNSIDLTAFLNLVGTGDRPALAAYLLAEVRRLVDAGADLAFFASNTPHLVFDEVHRESPVPLVSIVEAAAARAKALGFTRLGLLGTRFTMDAPFYSDVGRAHGLTILSPPVDDRDEVHRIYMTELVAAVFHEQSRQRLLAVVERLRSQQGAEAVILGGTELPLILGPGTPSPVPLLDTTAIHVEAVLERLQAMATTS